MRISHLLLNAAVLLALAGCGKPEGPTPEEIELLIDERFYEELERLTQPDQLAQTAQELGLARAFEPPSVSKSELLPLMNAHLREIVEQRYPRSELIEQYRREIARRYEPYKVGDNVEFVIRGGRGLDALAKGTVEEVSPQYVVIDGRRIRAFELGDREKMLFYPKMAEQNKAAALKARTAILDDMRKEYAQEKKVEARTYVCRRTGYLYVPNTDEYVSQFVALLGAVEQKIEFLTESLEREIYTQNGYIINQQGEWVRQQLVSKWRAKTAGPDVAVPKSAPYDPERYLATVGQRRPPLDRLMSRADNGDPFSQWAAGTALASDVLARQFDYTADDSRGETWLTAAASSGHPRAQYELGRFFALRKGTDTDKGKALDWFLKAAQQEHAGAQFEAGELLMQQRTAANQAIDKALELLKKSAALGNEKAEARLLSLANDPAAAAGIRDYLELRQKTLLQRVTAAAAAAQKNPRSLLPIQELESLYPLVTNREIKAAILAAVALGFRGADNEAAAQSYISKLRALGPASPYIKVLADEYVAEGCPACKGTGESASGGECPKCRGNKTVVSSRRLNEVLLQQLDQIINAARPEPGS